MTTSSKAAIKTQAALLSIAECIPQTKSGYSRSIAAPSTRMLSSRSATTPTRAACTHQQRGTLGKLCSKQHLTATQGGRLKLLGAMAADEGRARLGLTGAAAGNASGVLLNELEQDNNGEPAPEQPPVTEVIKPRKNIWALKSVLKVFVNKVDPNYAQPWQKCPQRSSSGSAFILDVGRRWIMTNAHVVDNATTVYVRRPGVPKKWTARVVCLGKMCDLALLTVEEGAFWAGDLRALECVDVPELQSPIAVAGYPVGGDSLSITKGIVSRITTVRYAAATKLLGIQIDAAINPGNSGGPAFADLEEGKVAGVAFSKNVSSSTDNIGYVIPRRIVEHFLHEYMHHGSFRGIASAGVATQTLENPFQRAFLQVPEQRSGCAIVKIDQLSEAKHHLQVNDVIMQVDGSPVADDETVQFRDDERLEWTHVVHCKHIGDELHLLILRDGKELEVRYTLQAKKPLVPILHGVDCIPSYFTMGGLVFMPLSLPLLENAFGARKWRNVVPAAVLAAFNLSRAREEQQIVILVQVLSHEINHGYKYTVTPCHSFNGTKVRNLRHLAHLVDRCEEQYINFGLENGKFITLDRARAAAATPEILETNAISSDRSADLRAVQHEPYEVELSDDEGEVGNAVATTDEDVAGVNSSEGHEGEGWLRSVAQGLQAAQHVEQQRLQGAQQAAREGSGEALVKEGGAQGCHGSSGGRGSDTGRGGL